MKMADVLDSLAAAATMEMGEGSDHTSVAIIKDLHHIEFFNKTHRPAVMRRYMYVRPDRDIYKKMI